MFGLPIVTCSFRLSLMLCVFRHDTPQFYISTKQYDKCLKVFKLIYKPGYADELIKEMQEKNEGK